MNDAAARDAGNTSSSTSDAASRATQHRAHGCDRLHALGLRRDRLSQFDRLQVKRQQLREHIARDLSNAQAASNVFLSARSQLSQGMAEIAARQHLAVL